MYLSNRDIKWAIDCGQLIVDPLPEEFGAGYDETSIDLHLAAVESAKIWTLDKLEAQVSQRAAEDKRRGKQGAPPVDPAEVYIGQIEYEPFSKEHQVEIPLLSSNPEAARDQLVFRRGDEIVVRRFGFLLWPTEEKIGTPKIDPGNLTGDPQRHPELICFVNAKSTRARTGLLVHFTAPTIHAGWDGNVVLEIANLGPFTFVLKKGDPLAQLTVATISSAPDLRLKTSKSATQGQTDSTGSQSASKATGPEE